MEPALFAGLISFGGLLVSLIPILWKYLAPLKRWFHPSSRSKFSVRIELDGQALQLDAADAEQAEELIQAFLEKSAKPSQSVEEHQGGTDSHGDGK